MLSGLVQVLLSWRTCTSKHARADTAAGARYEQRLLARLTASVRVCRDKPARCEGVQVSDSEGRANHAGPESCAAPVTEPVKR